RHDLLFNRDSERDVERLGATGLHLYALVLVSGEARLRDAQRVASGRERGEDVVALLVRHRRLCYARGVRHSHGRADDDAAQLIRDLPAQSAERLLSARWDITTEQNRERQDERPTRFPPQFSHLPPP